MSDVLSRLTSQKPYVVVFENHFEFNALHIDYNYFSIQI